MRVTEIVPYGKTRSKVLFDEGLVLVLYKSEIFRLKISEGCEVSETNYKQLIVPLLLKRAKERIVYILKGSDKSEKELRQKLKSGFYPPEVIDETIKWGKEHHYIDDRRYAENLVNYRSKGKSRQEMERELLVKGIDKGLISEFLESADINEEEQIALELKKRKYSPDMDKKEKQKILMALIRRGYGFEQVLDCMKDCD